MRHSRAYSNPFMYFNSNNQIDNKIFEIQARLRCKSEFTLKKKNINIKEINLKFTDI